MKTGKLSKDKMIRLIACCAVALGGMIWWHNGMTKETEPVVISSESSPVIQTEAQNERSEIKEEEVKETEVKVGEEKEQSMVLGVHVSGAVNGADRVYLLPEGSRIIDAIEAAGGAKDTADLSLLNLAEYIVDGERIFVPEKEGKVTASQDRYQMGQFVIVPEEIQQDLTDDASGGGLHLTNINEATKIELMELPGIGENYAERIIQYRETMGPFGSIEEIMNVSGIGESKFEKLKTLISVE